MKFAFFGARTIWKSSSLKTKAIQLKATVRTIAFSSIERNSSRCSQKVIWLTSLLEDIL